jgi:hypothetical protein
MKPNILRSINQIAARFEILPDGISRSFVRGFLASISLSTYLLKAIAELLAKTMDRITKINLVIKSVG